MTNHVRTSTAQYYGFNYTNDVITPIAVPRPEFAAAVPSQGIVDNVQHELETCLVRFDFSSLTKDQLVKRFATYVASRQAVDAWYTSIIFVDGNEVPVSLAQLLSSILDLDA